ncbi:hypothetical protein EPUS_05561 [Endocarpon pusillum Z07020]|uniref:Uncharacterized protein n=1 Tax=Endocarpon pusillum (strain Z07020 / HMAS-L-300199) TaxID=1263415 RepID=U1GPH2_ENDPU|nr:uncharacterized protein EPUS_05561 [Endocarpon pusillum Z07020]ERF73856.1 hypothetical protein EPUS_05561 [Endocarpon pusillum Z07020]
MSRTGSTRSNPLKSLHSAQMDPSVQPFYSHETLTQPRPMFTQQSPYLLPMPSQPALPSYPSQQLEMSQQAPSNTSLPFPPRPQMTGPTVPNHSPEALVADMWKTCPALCASIRHDFDVNTIFHPSLIALHGETLLRLAASQIAMQNQATEMTHLRNDLSAKQSLLEVNAASVKDLQTKFVAQQSELNEIRRLLEQQPRSLTNSDAIGNGQIRQSRSQEGGITKQGAIASPLTPVSSLTELDGPIHKFYNRSVALPPLKVILAPDHVNEKEEKHGYGHAETQGPSFDFDRAEDCTSTHLAKQRPDQPCPIPPTTETATIFEPDASARPVVSVVTREQKLVPRDNEVAKTTVEPSPNQHQASAVRTEKPPAPIKIMTRQDSNESTSQKAEQAETTTSSMPNEVGKTTSATPSRTECNNDVHDKRPTVSANKPVSYAAAVRTTPVMPPKDESSSMQPPSDRTSSSPVPDLGFTLEPLPKPTMQQVQSQHQQAQSPQQQVPTPTSEPQQEVIPFNFEVWRQRKIAAGTWKDRSNNHHHPHNVAPDQRSNHPNHPSQHQRPYHTNYRGRGGRFHQQHHHYNGNNENLRRSPLSHEEQRQAWLAWKQDCIDRGTWNPKHPFRAAWKNE